VDAIVDFDEINDELWRALEMIAPFGMDNRRPVFAARGVQLAGAPQIWKEKHIKLAAKQSGRTLMLKGWNLADLATELRGVKTVDIAFEIERDFFGGRGLTLRACRESVAGLADATLATTAGG
jgi:single-stranded-DNA-specific exonuclease